MISLGISRLLTQKHRRRHKSDNDTALWSGLRSRAAYYLCDLDEEAAERFSAEYTLRACVHLYGHRDLLFGEIHHVGHVARKETAVAVGRAGGLRWADDHAEAVFYVRPEL